MKSQATTVARTGEDKVRAGIIDRHESTKARKAKTDAREERTRSQTGTVAGSRN
jgi:hypothetical protein